jgi:hypothetical protein
VVSSGRGHRGVRAKRVMRLLNQGLISKEELEQRRGEILRELVLRILDDGARHLESQRSRKP